MTEVISRRHCADQPMPGLYFRGMAAMFKLRDWLVPRNIVLDEVPVQVGHSVLDYGCGPGSYIPGLAERVGETGRIVAVDIHPLAVERVRALVVRQGLRNVEAHLTDGQHLSHLANGSINCVLLFDIFHMLGDQAAVLSEIHRVLASNGVLAVHDPHMQPDALVAGVMKAGPFQVVRRGARVMLFAPATGDREKPQ